jgi:uncharacterized protein (DUF1697 family)
MDEKQKYVALLRGINVGGHHKVPMAALRGTLEAMGFTGVQTLLNSGNVIFEGTKELPEMLEQKIGIQLENTFGFPIPVLIRKSDDIQKIISADPFKEVSIHKDIRLYITFLKEIPQDIPNLPWVSSDGAYRIVEIKDSIGAVCSILDLSQSKTLIAMDVLEKFFGKNITTRNWNTIIRIKERL